MKALIALVLLLALGPYFLGVWNGLGPMEKVWAVIVVLALASLFVPGLRPLAVRIMLLVFLMFFLVSLYDKTMKAYEVTSGKLKDTLAYVVADLWSMGGDWLGSLIPSLGGDTVMGVAKEYQGAEAAYSRCLAGAIADLQSANQLDPALQRKAASCGPPGPAGQSCLEEVLYEADPSRAAACNRQLSIGTARGGAKTIADIFCARWLPESVQDAVCIDRQRKPGSADAAPEYRFDEARVGCLASFANQNSVPARHCSDQFTNAPQRWEQCVVGAITAKYGAAAEQYVRACGAVP